MSDVLIAALALAVLLIWTLFELWPYIEQNRHRRTRQKDK